MELLPMIKVENLQKSFGPNMAVNGVSFEINAGDVVGFLGPNGAGKTTTMRMITTYLAADSGRIEIDGADVTEDPLGVRQQIGYLPEAAPLYQDMEVLEYLVFVASIRRIPRTERSRRIGAIVDSCGLGEVLRRKIGYLSKGYRQRVGLAQSMVHDPRILILDEPTTGLDPNQIVEIRNLIRDIGRDKTVILSTHILSEVQSTCNRALIINRGRIAADGRPEQLAGAIKGGGITYTVSFKGEAAAVETVLGAASFLSGFDRERDDQGALVYSLAGTESNDIGEKIFRMAVDNKLVLTELRREVASLESIFGSLTTGEVEA
jgi:ABC-2 type transport system ATP-binding protein